MVPPLVSVICPTYGRPDYHEYLYKVFASQTYPFKELRVLDDSASPSMFFVGLSDPRVHYAWTPNRMSIGAKRNTLIAESAGRVIAHQDDDDLYRRQYLATMVGRLGKDALTKLSVWDARSAFDGSIWRWDTRATEGTHFAVMGSAPALRLPDGPLDMGDNALWGYGFSYVFTRDAWKRCPFADMNLGEDMAFVESLRTAGAPVSHQTDLPDIVLHTIHERSTSRIYPQECIAHCRPVGAAPPGKAASYGPTVTQAGSAVPEKISLVPGRTYQAVALVKNSHASKGLAARASGYGLSVLAINDNVPAPPGLPPPTPGYRYMAVRLKAKKSKTVRTAIPFPFSYADSSRVVSLLAS
jgi:hypothetical protein